MITHLAICVSSEWHTLRRNVLHFLKEWQLYMVGLSVIHNILKASSMIIHLQFGFHLQFRNFRERNCNISLRCPQPLQPIAKSFATMTWLTVTEYLCHKWSWICNHNPVLSSFIFHHRVCYKSKATGDSCGARTAYSSGAPEFI
jgi:hypothetical protein